MTKDNDDCSNSYNKDHIKENDSRDKSIHLSNTFNGVDPIISNRNDERMPRIWLQFASVGLDEGSCK